MKRLTLVGLVIALAACGSAPVLPPHLRVDRRVGENPAVGVASERSVGEVIYEIYNYEIRTDSSARLLAPISVDVLAADFQLGPEDPLVLTTDNRNPSQFHAPPSSVPESPDKQQPGPAPRPHRPESTQIFIVHGHDGEAKQTVARFLEQLNLVPIILHEQASRGRTLIEKLEVYADVGFAIVLLTPDDFGRARNDSQEEPRARQNVIFEMGFFFARLGRDRICALSQDVALPSDIAGLASIAYDRLGAWKMDLFRELRAAGYDVDLNQS